MLNVVRNIFYKFYSKKDTFITSVIVLNVIWIFLGMFFYNYFKFSYQNFSISLLLLFIINFFFIIFINVRGRIKFDKIDICLILLVVFGIISTIFSKNISVSLYGYWKRYEGLSQILYYYSLLYLSSFIFDNVYKKKIICFILIFGFINVFACFLQVFNIFEFIPINSRGVTLGQGFITNSNFFGSYMDICLGLSIGLFLYNNRDNFKKNILFLIFILVFYSGLLMSNALSGMVGLFVICLFIVGYFIYLFIKKRIVKSIIIKHVILLISCVIISIVLTISNKTVMFDDVKRMFVETQEISKGNINDSFGSSRLFIWKSTLKVVPNNLLHGTGIDCFAFAFSDEKPLFKKRSDESIVYFDKAHNEYLQKLVTEGTFSTITYISMLFIIFIISLKNILKNNNYLLIPLFLAFVGYCVQAFFNISVIEVAPLFFIVCGLLYERKCKV